MAMDLREYVKGGARACAAALGLHDTVEDEGQEADHDVGADVLIALRMDAHGGQIIEDDRQIAIDQSADLAGQLGLNPVDIVDRRVHGTQEMMMSTLADISGTATVPNQRT